MLKGKRGSTYRCSPKDSGQTSGPSMIHSIAASTARMNSLPRLLRVTSYRRAVSWSSLRAASWIRRCSPARTQLGEKLVASFRPVVEDGRPCIYLRGPSIDLGSPRRLDLLRGEAGRIADEASVQLFDKVFALVSG